MSISKLGRYDITRVLGKGAMGLVYEARDPNLDRRVAIKTIKVENLSAEASADYDARFRTEARSAARLQHPNIVSVYDSERHGDVAYLVMEFVQGDDLKQHLDGGKRYSLQESLGIVRDLLAALDYAHRQNIVHRDVKPANLLVEANGRVKLTDFGVARIQDSGEATRTKGSMVGTLKYMSPEQVQGLPVDARADLFAAGIVLYQLLTGKRPFDGDSEFAIIHQIVSQNPAAPSSINAQLPPALDAVVARALSKQRDDRFATAHDFSLALLEASGQAPDPTIVPPPSLRDARIGSNTATGSLRSRAGGSTVGLGTAGEGSGSTVTQELELVYWKDVKDSDDPEDLQGFMDRFPAGIYADLARRRLKKFLDRERGEHSGTQSATMALPLPTAGAAAASTEGTATRSERPRVPPDEPTAVLPADVTAAPSGDATMVLAVAPTTVSPGEATMVERHAPQAPEPAASAFAAASTDDAPSPLDAAEPPSSGLPHDVPPPPTATEPEQPPARRGKAPLFAGLAVAVLAVAGIVFTMSSGGPAPGADALPAPAASASAAGVAAAASEPVPVSVAAVPAASAPVGVASTPVAVALPKSAARPASAALDKSVARSLAPKSANAETAPGAGTAAPAAPSAPTAVSAVAKPAPSRAVAEAPVAAAQSAATSPAKACEGRVLLGFQSCMNEQCAKPVFANLAVCVERRTAASQTRGAQNSDRN
jgi:serine/threonine-protein kinase